MIRELRRKREELQAERAEIDQKLTAINTVIDMFEGNGEGVKQETLPSEVPVNEVQTSESPKPSLGIAESSVNGHPQKIAITEEVRKAVQEFDGRFTTQDVVQRIRAKYPQAEVKPTPVSTALGRMVRRKESIRVVREGEAWEPNIYERFAPDPTLQENSVAEEHSVK